MSESAIHKRKTVIVRKLNGILSESDSLRSMILELRERDVTDHFYIDEIVTALKDLEQRINNVIESLINAPVVE
jgi:capsid portal protein